MPAVPAAVLGIPNKPARPKPAKKNLEKEGYVTVRCPSCGDLHCSEVIEDAMKWRRERERRRKYMAARRAVTK